MKKPLNLDSDFESFDSDKTNEIWNIGYQCFESHGENLI